MQKILTNKIIVTLIEIGIEISKKFIFQPYSN
jgi:hypothetical protein